MDDAATATAQGSPRRRSRLPLIFAPLPGIGHWVIGRGGRGWWAFAIFATGANFVALSRLLAPVAKFPSWIGYAIAAIGVLFSIVDVTRIVLGTRSEGRPGR